MPITATTSRIRFLAYALVLGCSCPLSGIEAAEPVIDMHLHAFGFDEYGYPPPPNEVTGTVPDVSSDRAAIDAILAAMKEFNIVRAVASGPLNHAYELKTASPERFLVGAYVGPRDDLPELTELRILLESGKIEVLGELGLQYRGIAANSLKLEGYWELAAEFDVPVGIHTGLGDEGTPHGCCPDFRARLGNPILLEDVLVKYPNLRVYLMHGGYPFIQETKAMLTIYPQVYVDVAVINWAIPRKEFHNYLRALVEAGFADRIMFGSDQMVWPESIGLAIAGIESADFLTEEQKRSIFYDNAARFLRLTEQQVAEDYATK